MARDSQVNNGEILETVDIRIEAANNHEPVTLIELLGQLLE
jgi:hypothetical protein